MCDVLSLYGEESVHLPPYQDQVLLVIEQFYAALLVQDKKLCSDELLGDVADHTFMVGGVGGRGSVLYITSWLAASSHSHSFTSCGVT